MSKGGRPGMEGNPGAPLVLRDQISIPRWTSSSWIRAGAAPRAIPNFSAAREPVPFLKESFFYHHLPDLTSSRLGRAAGIPSNPSGTTEPHAARPAQLMKVRQSYGYIALWHCTSCGGSPRASGPGLWPGPRRQARWAGRGLRRSRVGPKIVSAKRLETIFGCP